MHRTIERIVPGAPAHHLEVVRRFATQVLVYERLSCMPRRFPVRLIRLPNAEMAKPEALRSTDRGGTRYREGNSGSILTLASDLLQCIFDLIDLIDLVLAPHLIFTSHMIFH